MGQVFSSVLTIAGGIGALIFVYLLFAHPDAVVAEIKVVNSFVVGETKALQGR